jgi:hypothetical protein
MANYCNIEIDCHPGYPRPNNVLTWVLDTIKENNDINANQLKVLNNWATLIPRGGGKFGNFSWEMPYDLDEMDYEEIKDQIMVELTKYYNSQTIRYGSISNNTL